MAPDFEFILEDVIAIMMLCGYESVIKGRGKTEFCKADIFDAEDYRNFEYFFDLIYHKVRYEMRTRSEHAGLTLRTSCFCRWWDLLVQSLLILVFTG